MWSALATAFGAVLTALGGLLGASHRSRIGRRIKYHAELADAVASAPDAQAELKALLTAEARELRRREERRLARHLNVTFLVFSVLFTGAAAVGVYYLIQWARVPSPLQWVAVLVTVVAGLLALLLALAFFSSIYNTSTTDTSDG